MEVKSAVGKHITCPAMILTWEEVMWNGTAPAALASQKPFHTGQQCLSSIDRYGNIHFSTCLLHTSCFCSDSELQDSQQHVYTTETMS